MLSSEKLIIPRVSFHAICFDKNGKVRWEDKYGNIVTDEGVNDIIDKYLKGSAYTAAWYMGLRGTGSPAAGDTLASHAGWSELEVFNNESPFARRPITWGTTTSKANTATAVSFAIDATATVAGAFITTAVSGSSGILYSVGTFSSNRSVLSGDTLSITPTLGGDDDGV